jgi:autotransporter-associated beta strand protein
LAAVLTAGRAAAQTNYYWNGDSGNWDTTSALWRSPTIADNLGPWVNGSSNVAQIGDLGSPGNLTVMTDIIASAVNVNASGFALQTNTTLQITINGNLNLASGVTLNLNNAATTNSDRNLGISGDISGGTAIRIQGSQNASRISRVSLAGDNTTVSTAVIINQSGAGAAGLVSTANGVQVTGTITNNSSGKTLIGADDNKTLSLASTAVISGSQGVRFFVSTNGGGGTVTLNSQSTYGGATVFNLKDSGTVKLGVNNALPTATAVSYGGLSTSSGGIFDLNGFNQEVASLATGTNSAGSIRNNAASTTSTLTVSGSTDPGSFDVTIADGSGKVALLRSGTGTLTLTGSNTFTGGTTVSSGTLVLGHATNALADAGAVTINGGTLSLGTNSDAVGAVTLASGSITSSTGVLSGSSYDVQSGTISARLGGSGAMTKTTPGTVTLSGDNSYSGGTAVNAGTLLVTGTGSTIAGPGLTTVNSGGTLGGDTPSGSIAAVTVASGGKLAPGLSGTSTGILKSVSEVTLQSGSTFEVQIKGQTAGTEHDQLFLTGGNVSLAGTLSVDFSEFTPNGNEQFLIIRNVGSGSLTGTFTNYADGATVATYGGYDWKIFYGPSADSFGGSDANDVVLVATAVPEPGSILALCALAAGTFVIRRRVRPRSDQNS